MIYSGGADLDILPQHASKGKGLEFLLNEVSMSIGLLIFDCSSAQASKLSPLSIRVMLILTVNTLLDHRSVECRLKSLWVLPRMECWSMVTPAMTLSCLRYLE